MKKRKNFSLKTIIILSLVFFVFGLNITFAQVNNYPLKSLAYWTSPKMSPSEAINLAKHDILVVDLENKFNNYQSLLIVKRLNPNLELLCYSNAMEINLTKYVNRPWQNKIIDEITINRSIWLLKTVTSSGVKNASMWERFKSRLVNEPTRKEAYATFWPGMMMINMSSSCPKINGQTYSDWMAKILLAEVLSDQIWDGYFLDNGTANISWTHPNLIDIDGDQQADRNELVDHAWKQGMENFLMQIRQEKGKKFIIISNKGDLNFIDKVNGKLFEKFPNSYLGDKWAEGWRQCLKNATHTGEYTVFQANRANIQFVLASALLLDNVYIAVSQDDSGYFPELNLNLGQPLGPYENKNGIYYRKYERAEIMVNPLQKIGKITIR
jgi:hypothetical protein